MAAPVIAKKNKGLFREKLLQWHTEQNTRQMPWKGEKDPYKIWLSEIILQQTRVQQGWQYYQRFTQQYPTITRLAAAPDDEVFKLWEGLGYYSRCKNLLATARHISFERQGIFPDTYEAILQLKGVGPYTAAAIASFAFGLPYAVVDGNVYRVLARWFGIDTPVDIPAGKLLFNTLANDCLPAGQPAAYNQAIMDFGATVCTPANPQCSRCPLQNECIAYHKGLINKLPVKTKTLQKTNRWYTCFIIEHKGQVLVRKRMEKDIWQNLHEFYLQPGTQMPEWTAATAGHFLQQTFHSPALVESISAPVRQQLTHQTVFIIIIRAVLSNAFQLPEGYFLQEKLLLEKLAFPQILRAALQQPVIPTLLF